MKKKPPISKNKKYPLSSKLNVTCFIIIMDYLNPLFFQDGLFHELIYVG